MRCSSEQVSTGHGLSPARLGDAGIGAIYTSAATRAIATAVPLANAKEIPLSIDDASIHAEDMGRFFDRLRQQHASARAILVVGHSNTVPQLLATLGATPECRQRLGVVESEGTALAEGHEGRAGEPSPDRPGNRPFPDRN